jgi:hypothetical protein
VALAQEDQQDARVLWRSHVEYLVGELPVGKDEKEVCSAMALDLLITFLQRQEM